jgi:tetratricopeptide (TPR) repeat protein
MLDRYQGQWLDARTDACTATRLRGDQSTDVLDARVRCLDRRRSELAVLTRLLGEHPTPEVVDRAVQAAIGLTPIESCSATGVAAEPPPPPHLIPLVAAVDGELAAIDMAVLVKTRLDVTVAQVKNLVDRARTIGYPPLVMRAARTLSGFGTFSSDLADTERTLFDSLHAAAAAHDDREVARVWIQLVAFAASDKGDAALAHTYARVAETAVLRADSPFELSVSLAQSRGVAFLMQGEHVKARDILDQAVAEARRWPTKTSSTMLWIANAEIALCNVEVRLGHLEKASSICKSPVTILEKELGPGHPMVGFALLGSGHVALQLRDNPTARVDFERARQILADTVGERHLGYAAALQNLGLIAKDNEELDASRRYLEQALVIYEEHHHPDAFSPNLNLGDLERKAGNYKAARQRLDRALVIAETTHGKDSERAASVWFSLGGLEAELDLGHARAAYERSLQIASAKHGDNHPQSLNALGGLGFALWVRDEYKPALGYLKRAIAASDHLYGDNHPKTAELLTLLGDCQRELHDPAALANLERALSIHDRHPASPPTDTGFTRWVLARALWELAGAKVRPRALELAKQAGELYAKSRDPYWAETRQEIAKWLASRAR